MPSPSASDRRYLGASIALAIGLAAGVAHADDKKVCGDAYDATQKLRLRGQLQMAHEQAVLCTRDTCAEFVRADCSTWLLQIDASQPTIVFEVRDRAGHDLSAVRVALDGRAWLGALDVQARPIDPGTHTLRFEAAGAPAVEQKVVVREGEKNKKVAVILALGAPPLPLASPTSPTPAAKRQDNARPIAPWVIGGVGVAALGVGAVTGAVVLGHESTFNDHCDEVAQKCDPEGIQAGKDGRALAPVSTVALVLGALGVGVATVWLVADAADNGEPSTTVGAGARVTADGGGLSLHGRFR